MNPLERIKLEKRWATSVAVHGRVSIIFPSTTCPRLRGRFGPCYVQVGMHWFPYFHPRCVATTTFQGSRCNESLFGGYGGKALERNWRKWRKGADESIYRGRIEGNRVCTYVGIR